MSIQRTLAATTIVVVALCAGLYCYPPATPWPPVNPPDSDVMVSRIPEPQEPLLKTYPPQEDEQTTRGVGKFVIFTREQIGEDWDFIAGAWECLPSRPEAPITKRVEFCHSSWNAAPLLDTLVNDDSEGELPRFVRLQVDHREHGYSINLYDIDYRTWDVRCIWQGDRLSAFGRLQHEVYCQTGEDWMALDAETGVSSQPVPFIPLACYDKHWLVRKPGESKSCWSYNRESQQFVARFRESEDGPPGFGLLSCLSEDGRSRAWVSATSEVGWEGGRLQGSLVVQRDGSGDEITVPIELFAISGSGVRYIPIGIGLRFPAPQTVEFRAAVSPESTDEAVWSVDVKSGSVRKSLRARLFPAGNADSMLDGVPVPVYLRPNVQEVRHYGRAGLAPLFLVHQRVLPSVPEYPDCHAGISPDGRHVLFAARNGPLAGVYIYGDLVTQQSIRWHASPGLDPRDAQDFVWVETPY